MWTKALIQVRIKLWSSRNVTKPKKKKRTFSGKCPMHFIALLILTLNCYVGFSPTVCCSETLWSDESKGNMKTCAKRLIQVLYAGELRPLPVIVS